MIQFICENYQWLSVLVFDLIIAVFALIRRVKIVDSPLAKVLIQLPGFISFAESKLGSGAGSDKLGLVVRLANSYYQSLGGQNDITAVIVEKVESILSTPTKKGDLNEKI